MEWLLRHMICISCHHPAWRHAGYWSACADCWAAMQPICDRFIVAAADELAWEALTAFADESETWAA